MTRYMVDKVLWRYVREPEFKAALNSDPATALAAFDLEPTENAALGQRDIRAIFQLGAHPFLLYSFAIALNNGWSFEFMQEYVGKLNGLELGDITT